MYHVLFGKMVTISEKSNNDLEIKKKNHKSVTGSHLNYTKVLKCSSE